MIFTEDSAIVRIWVNAVLSGSKTLEDVPRLFNLKDVVEQIVKGEDK